MHRWSQQKVRCLPSGGKQRPCNPEAGDAGAGTGNRGVAAVIGGGRRRRGRTYAGGMAVVKINAIEVPEDSREELEARFAARLGAVENQPGFLGFELLRPVSGDSRYFVYTRWESQEAYDAWANGSGKAAHAGERKQPVSSSASLLEFEVVQEVHPKE